MYYFTDKRIIKMNLKNRRNSTVVQSKNNAVINSFLVDEYQDKLYWIESYVNIYHSNLDGSNVEKLNFKRDDWIDIFLIDQEYIYFRSFPNSVFVRRANKFSGDVDKKFKIDGDNGDDRALMKFIFFTDEPKAFQKNRISLYPNLFFSLGRTTSRIYKWISNLFL